MSVIQNVNVVIKVREPVVERWDCKKPSSPAPMQKAQDRLEPRPTTQADVPAGGKSLRALPRALSRCETKISNPRFTLKMDLLWMNLIEIDLLGLNSGGRQQLRGGLLCLTKVL